MCSFYEWSDVTQLDLHTKVRNLDTNEVTLHLICTANPLIRVEVSHLGIRVELRHVTPFAEWAALLGGISGRNSKNIPQKDMLILRMEWCDAARLLSRGENSRLAWGDSSFDLHDESPHSSRDFSPWYPSRAALRYPIRRMNTRITGWIPGRNYWKFLEPSLEDITGKF